MSLHTRAREALGSAVVREQDLAGGCIADVRRLTLADGRDVVAKVGQGLALEGFMLSYLAEHSRLPVPEVFFSAEDLLLMDYLPTSGSLSDASQEDAADHLAALRGVTGPAFGFARTTVIGGLKQPNDQAPSWLEFFREQRLMYMTEAAVHMKKLPPEVALRIAKLAERLDRWIDESAKPTLIHGDMWTGNVLVNGDRIAGFVDPAIYYADPEIELAFSTLFGTFSEAFFKRYAEHHPLRPGFEERKDLYNLYPLLVHVRLFGAHYVGDVEIILRRFGV
ncbi:MAG: fructosamine kinase family protein [Proteobacteria bacterium]|nr:fructosamine kinase family protein [Pseudomonadota bacterium]